MIKDVTLPAVLAAIKSDIPTIQEAVKTLVVLMKLADSDAIFEETMLLVAEEKKNKLIRENLDYLKQSSQRLDYILEEVGLDQRKLEAMYHEKLIKDYNDKQFRYMSTSFPYSYIDPLKPK